jgi:hypothetical protein
MGRDVILDNLQPSLRDSIRKILVLIHGLNPVPTLESGSIVCQ